MVIPDIILPYLAVVLHPRLCQEVRRVRFLEEGVAHIFLIGEHLVDGSLVPFLPACHGWDARAFQMLPDARDAHPLQVQPEDELNHLRLLRHDLQLAVPVLFIAHEAATVHDDSPVLELPRDAPAGVLAQVPAFLLCLAAEYRDEHLAGIVQRIDTLLFEIYRNLLRTEQPDGVQHIGSVPREAADGFCQHKVYLPGLAVLQ